jgi:DNA-binding transcriptional ArsR family regulator
LDTAGQLVDLLGEAQPAVSKHLRVLRDVGLASSEVAGPVRVYSIDLDGFGTLEAWLEPYRRQWEATLDRLEQVLDEQEHRP